MNETRNGATRADGREIMDRTKLDEILKAHSEWRQSFGARGSRANLADAYLTGANLTGAYLAGAYLAGANLAGAYLTGANLTGANLTGANLAGAYLAGANLAGANLAGAYLAGANLAGAYLAGANLDPIRDDLYAVLASAPAEVPGLLAALKAGRVDGTTYSGECACLVGTIANIRGCAYSDMPDLRPNSERSAERWFLAIETGHTPENSTIAKITAEWIVAWLSARAHEATAAAIASTQQPVI